MIEAEFLYCRGIVAAHLFFAKLGTPQGQMHSWYVWQGLYVVQMLVHAVRSLTEALLRPFLYTLEP